jgi:surface antigen
MYNNFSFNSADGVYMHQRWLKVFIMLLLVNLSGCSGQLPALFDNSQTVSNENVSDQEKGLMGKSVDQEGKQTNVNVTMTGGGEIGLMSMNEDDKIKMSRALDAATGKSTQWKNMASGISYTVTPIRKVVIQNNPFCREYQVVVAKGENTKAIQGTACVTTDGGWHTI